MNLGLAGRRAFVGGASKGLGFAVARALHEEGARVAISARDREALEAARAQLDAVAIPADLGRADEGRRAVERARSELGGLDILVTNGGGPPPGLFEAHDEEAWRNAFELLLLSTVAQIRAALPALEKSEQARIVLITSSSIKQPMDQMVLSNSLRTAVAGLAKTLATELAPRGILVNVVGPGAIDTDRIRSLNGSIAKSSGRSVEDVAAERTSKIPLGRLGHPDEFGAVVAFLCSAQASYLTGTVLPVDGGSTRSLL